MDASSPTHFPEIRALRRNWRSGKRAESFRATSYAGSSFSESRPQVRLTSKLRKEGRKEGNSGLRSQMCGPHLIWDESECIILLLLCKTKPLGVNSNPCLLILLCPPPPMHHLFCLHSAIFPCVSLHKKTVGGFSALEPVGQTVHINFCSSYWI